MAVERRDGLVEVGGSRWERGLEFAHPADVVEVDTEDLGWPDRGQMVCLVDRDAPAVLGYQFVAIDFYWGVDAIFQDAADLSCAHQAPRGVPQSNR